MMRKRVESTHRVFAKKKNTSGLLRPLMVRLMLTNAGEASWEFCGPNGLSSCGEPRTRQRRVITDPISWKSRLGCHYRSKSNYKIYLIIKTSGYQNFDFWVLQCIGAQEFHCSERVLLSACTDVTYRLVASVTRHLLIVLSVVNQVTHVSHDDAPYLDDCLWTTKTSYIYVYLYERISNFCWSLDTCCKISIRDTDLFFFLRRVHQQRLLDLFLRKERWSSTDEVLADKLIKRFVIRLVSAVWPRAGDRCLSRCLLQTGRHCCTTLLYFLCLCWFNFVWLHLAFQHLIWTRETPEDIYTSNVISLKYIRWFSNVYISEYTNMYKNIHVLVRLDF